MAVRATSALAEDVQRGYDASSGSDQRPRSHGLSQDPTHWRQQAALALQAMGECGGGRLVALAGADAARHKQRMGEQSSGASRSGRQGALGASLLPGRYQRAATLSTPMALMWQIAANPVNAPQRGADAPEDPRFRALVTQTTPPVLLLELNAVATFNMMDADLAADTLFAM
ncbi:unnamed protein product, partial [Polarella glacialis]